MKMDQPTLKRLHIEATCLDEALLQKAKYTSKDTASWLQVASDHLRECVAVLSIALEQTKDDKEKVDV